MSSRRRQEPCRPWAWLIFDVRQMAFAKPPNAVAWATGLNILAGIFGTYLGIRESNLYFCIISPLLVVLSLGVWFELKAAAVALIGICIVFTIVGTISLFVGRFSWSLVFRIFVQLYTALVLWLWVKGIDIDDFE